jgi:hypothetical protein
MSSILSPRSVSGLWRSLLVSVAGDLQGFYRCGKLNLVLLVTRDFASDSRLVQLKAGVGLGWF